MNKSLDNFIKQHADKVFYHWERNTDESFIDMANKVGSYADYVDSLSDEDLAEVSELYYAGETTLTLLRKKINEGINDWFDKNRKYFFVH